MIILVLALFAQQGSAAEVSRHLPGLGARVYSEREAAQGVLERACIQDNRNVFAVGELLSSHDAEVRMRAWSVIRRTYPCGRCHGNGCATCEYTGSIWRPGQERIRL